MLLDIDNWYLYGVMPNGMIWKPAYHWLAITPRGIIVGGYN